MRHPLARRLTPFLQGDLSGNYIRNLHKWLLVAPLVGVTAGLVITLVATLILRWLWPAVLHHYLLHPWIIVPSLTAAFTATGLIMQYLTPDPNEHSTEEIIRSYHEHEGAVNLRSLPAKLLAAVLTVGFGGSAALEGPSIYGGAAIGSWWWQRLRGLAQLRLSPQDRRILLICGAAAGMSAVFRAPLTGIVFALEMPYKDDLAHEALLPSLIASVVSYMTLGLFLGGEPLFHFAAAGTFTRMDLLWSAGEGLLIGWAVLLFLVTFRRFRRLVLRLPGPHWLKLAGGGLMTGLCGVAFLRVYPGTLVPIGPNYEAVGSVLNGTHSSLQLVVFGLFKLAATTFTLGTGGVSAMFVPLFLTGGAFGTAFGQSVVHSGTAELYAAVGMAAFLAAAYKTPLAAVVFVAEAAGGHAILIPALIGAAVAYVASGELSVSADQRLHELRGRTRESAGATPLADPREGAS